MSEARLVKSCSSTNSIVLPDSELHRRVSLTGYTNILLDESNPDATTTEDAENNKVRDDILPFHRIGFFSYAFITWFSPLVWKMYKRRHLPVEEGDIWQCPEEDGLRVNSQRLTRLWNDEVTRKGPEKASLKLVWMKFILKRSLLPLFIVGINALASFLSSAFLLNWIVRYLESDVEDVLYGIGLSAAVLVCDLVRAVSYAVVNVYSAQTGIRCRGGYMGLVYNKLLKLRTVKGKVNSEIINVFSVDSYRIYLVTCAVPLSLSLPLYLIVATIYSYMLIDYWCFAGIGAFVVLYIGQMYLTKVLQMIRKSTSKYTDVRVRRMSEIINNMKFIKMYSWEKPFTSAVKGARMLEQKYQLYDALVNAIVLAIIPSSTTIASIVTLAAYTSSGNSLTPSTAFALIGTMDFLRIVVAFLPVAMRFYGAANVSFSRIEKVLLMEEYNALPNDVFDKKNAIEIKASNLTWEPGPTLKDEFGVRQEGTTLFGLRGLDLEVKKMNLTSGHLAVNGSVAYVAQQACIFNASVKENILFGRKYNAERYQHTIECCMLRPDMKLLADGDETEVGERGVNLSGGQKQRVNLARAVYSDSDIYLLDDPLSALDVRVGKAIFHECIQGQLKGKTVILVTHQLQYLKHCDDVVVMDSGVIVEKGVHEALLENKGIYTEMLRVFDKTAIKATPTCSPEEGEPDGYIKQPKSHEKLAKLSPPVIEASKVKTKKEKGKLIMAEDVATGEISMKAYSAYISAAGGWCVALFVLLLFAVSSGSVIFSEVWLSLWIDALSTWDGLNINSTTNGDSTTKSVNTTMQPTISTSGGILLHNIYFIVYVSSLGAVIVLTLVSGFGIAKVCIGASNRFHTGSLDRVMKAPMSFFDSNPAGRILNRFSKDLDEADVFIPVTVNTAFRMVMTFVISIIVTVYVTHWLLIGIIPLITAVYIMKRLLSITCRQLKRLENIAFSPVIAHVNTTSQSIPTIVLYGQQERFFASCSKLGDVSSLTIFLFETSMRWIGVRLELVALLVSVCLCVICVLSKGTITPAAAALALSLCGKTLKEIQIMMRVVNETDGRFTSIERLHEYQTQIELECQTGVQMTSDKWPDKGSVVFSNVVMRYRPDLDPVLRSVSFKILPNEKVGIVGRTGAGKSTLEAALFRLVELGDGHIFVDNEDISKLHLNAIRSKISTITQEPVLFSETVRYNVDPFSTYSDDQIWASLERVHLKEKIEQQDKGLEAMVEENGENYSVGERQLLCLTRALLRSSKILLLDEATANIDTSTDALIQQTIRECFADCTVITIAHRLNTVLHSDKIIVLDSGKVMECASPQDLLSDPHSFFNAMLTAQAAKMPGLLSHCLLCVNSRQDDV